MMMTMWPVALFLLLLHPPGTACLPADSQLCENIPTFKRHLITHLFKLTLVLLCRIKHLCTFGPIGAIQIRYCYYSYSYYYYYYHHHHHHQAIVI